MKHSTVLNLAELDSPTGDIPLLNTVECLKIFLRVYNAIVLRVYNELAFFVVHLFIIGKRLICKDSFVMLVHYTKYHGEQ